MTLWRFDAVFVRPETCVNVSAPTRQTFGTIGGTGRGA